MKVILINPPREVLQVADYPPLGLAYLSAAICQDGHEVKILDAASWSFKKLTNEIEHQSPDIIGITCWTIERGQAFKTARIAKQTAQNAKIIMGGPHATAFPKHMFIKAPTDYVVLGEGEETIRELLNVIGTNGNLSFVKGIAYRNHEDIVINERREMIKDIDTIPNINHLQFDYDKYNGLPDTCRKSAAIITSRGCPFRCTYCSSAIYWGCKYRARSIQSVMIEIEDLYYKQGIRALLIFDDNMLIARKRCIEFCKALIERKMDLVWAAEGSVKVDSEMLGWMKRAGCYRIDFGVESGSPIILKNINKPFTVDDTRNAFRLCNENSIRPNAYLIFGSPGETKETINETISLMREIQPNKVGGNPGIWILPDTKIYELSKEKNIITDETWLKTDKTLVYTGEHTEEELRALVKRFTLGMLKDYNNRRYYLFLLMALLPNKLDYIIRYIYKIIKNKVMSK
jgi:anaerobic magnesium-protoporphyrin IX monomethyl ester cyclase